MRQRVIRDTGRGVFYGASEQDVYALMEHFLDQTPGARGLKRTVRPVSTSPLVYEGVLIWTRMVPLSARRHA